MPRRSTISALALSAALALGGCQNPDGSTDWGSTLLVGAGVGLAAALVAGAASDNGRPKRRHYAAGYGPPRAYGHGYGRGGYPGHAGGYRGW